MPRGDGIDVLRLAVVPAVDVPGSDGEFLVEVYVNGVEMTSAGAGLGMDPSDLLIPTNRLVVTPRPHRVPIARCECGVYGCGATDVTITGDGELVHWDWRIEVPMDRGVSFAAAQYQAEVERLAADYSWETAGRTAGRLVCTHMDRAALGGYGLAAGWAGNVYHDPELFQVTLLLGGDYQIFVDFPWRGRTPEELADVVRQTLARRPAEWPASWHPIRPELTGPPAIAGPTWRRFVRHD